MFLTHNRVRLALHTLRESDGRSLLLLHGLGERSPDRVPGFAEQWDGPVAALDFTGHGASTIPRGGGYTAELLLGEEGVGERRAAEIDEDALQRCPAEAAGAWECGHASIFAAGRGTASAAE